MEEPKKIHTQAYVVSHKGAPFVLQDVILDEVRPDEVLVEMKYTGLCHTVCLYMIIYQLREFLLTVV